MVGDAKEHICSGCYEVIASHDPEAYQRGTFHYHSKAHENWHVFRNGDVFLKAEQEHSQEVFQEVTVRP
jgi:hypothetical protein